MKKQIEITQRLYPGNKGYPFRNGRRSYTAIQDGERIEVRSNSRENPIEFIEATLSTVISHQIARTTDPTLEPLEIEVTYPKEVTLSPQLETHLTDKYQAEELVESITFKAPE
ncbi:hypothetical protein [Gracilibacillus timonensis]|uniref:hypothetical protein n=1 Tax=Gracilibacillus timonensis TaxID=1816696 RepID=UPI000825D778|nr:hypothetical protein [Gracilibacillus timonensis]